MLASGYQDLNYLTILMCIESIYYPSAIMSPTGKRL